MATKISKVELEFVLKAAQAERIVLRLHNKSTHAKGTIADMDRDGVVLEGRPESLMWLALADLNRVGGKRRRGDTAVLQATCVDATIIPHVEQRLSFSLGCYGCREATDMGTEETILGFPGAFLEGLVAALERLSQKAVGRSRAKAAFRRATGGEASGKPGDGN